MNGDVIGVDDEYQPIIDEDQLNQWRDERWPELNEIDNNNIVIVLVGDKQECNKSSGGEEQELDESQENTNNPQHDHCQNESQTLQQSQQIFDEQQLSENEDQQPNNISHSSSKCDMRNSCSRDLVYSTSFNYDSSNNACDDHNGVVIIDNNDVNYDDDFDTNSNLEAINADDSGGGSYEDSNPMQGSQRNSLEKDDYDDEEDEIDVISTDVSCYDQVMINNRHADEGIIVIADDLFKINNGDGIYTNPFVGW